MSTAKRRATHDPTSAHAKEVASRLEHRLSTPVIEPARRQYDIAPWVDRRRYLVFVVVAALVTVATTTLALITRQSVGGRTTSCVLAAAILLTALVLWWPHRGSGPHRRLRLRVSSSGIRYDAIRDGRVHTFLLRDDWIRTVTVRRAPWWRLGQAGLEISLPSDKVSTPSFSRARLPEFVTGTADDGRTTLVLPIDDCSAPALTAALKGVLPGLWVDPTTREQTSDLAGTAAAFGRMVAPRPRDALHHLLGGPDVYLLAGAMCLLVFALPLARQHAGLLALACVALAACAATAVTRMRHHIRSMRYLALGDRVRLVGATGHAEADWADVDAVTIGLGSPVSSVTVEASTDTGRLRLETWQDFSNVSQVRLQDLLDEHAPRHIAVTVEKPDSGQQHPHNARDADDTGAGSTRRSRRRGPTWSDAARGGLLRYRAWQRIDRPKPKPSRFGRALRGLKVLFGSTPMALYPTRPVAGQIALDRPGLPLPAAALAAALVLIGESHHWWAWVVAVAGIAVLVWYWRRLQRPDRALRASGSGLSLLASAAGPVPAVTVRADAPGIAVSSWDWPQIAAVSMTDEGSRPQLRVYLNPGAPDGPGVRTVRAPSPDLPDRAVCIPLGWYAVPQAMNLMRWFAPDLLADPVTGAPVLGLSEPDDAPGDDGLRRQGKRPLVVGRLGRAGLSGAVRRSAWTVARALVSFVVLAYFALAALVFAAAGESEGLRLIFQAVFVPGVFALVGVIGIVRAFGMRPEYLVFGQDEVRYSDGPGYLPIPVTSIRQARLHGIGVARRLQIELEKVPPDPAFGMLLSPEPGSAPVLDLSIHISRPDTVPTDLAAAFAQRTDAPYGIGRWPLGEPARRRRARA